MSDNNEHINDFDQSFKNRFEEDGINPPDNAWNDLEAQFGQIENEAFDATVKEKFSEGVQPPSELWNQVDKATQKESRKFRGIYWIALGVLLGTLGTYLLVLKFDRQTTVSEIKNNPVNSEKRTKGKSINDNYNADKTEIQPHSKQLKEEDSFEAQKIAQQKKKSTTIIEKNEVSSIDLETAKQDEQATSVREDTPPLVPKADEATASVEKEGQSTANISEKAADLIKPKDDKSTDSKNTRVEANPSTPIKTEHENNLVAIEASTSPKTSKPDTSLNTVYSNDSISADTSNYCTIDSSLSTVAIDTLSETVTVAQADTTKKGKPKKKKLKNDSIKKWMITAYAVPEFQNQRATKSGTNNHFFDSLLTSNFSWLFELGVSYTFKNQFQFGLGLSMNKYSYHYSKSANGINSTIPIKANYPSGIVEVNGLFGNTQTVDLIEIQMAPQGADLNEFLNNKEILYSEKLDYTLVNIPFDLKWVPGTQRIKPVINIGGELNIIASSSSEVSLTFLQETTTVKNHAQLNGINFSGSFGLGTQIDLVKGLGITFLPSLNYQSAGVSKNSNFQFTPYSIRLYSGLYYKF